MAFQEKSERYWFTAGAKEVLGRRELPQGIKMDTMLPLAKKHFKIPLASLPRAQGLHTAKPGTRPLCWLKNAEKGNPVGPRSGRPWAPASRHTGHARGVDRRSA